jgi:hypothetical protein
LRQLPRTGAGGSGRHDITELLNTIGLLAFCGIVAAMVALRRRRRDP